VIFILLKGLGTVTGKAGSTQKCKVRIFNLRHHGVTKDFKIQNNL
jgi:hypothetical protein